MVDKNKTSPIKVICRVCSRVLTDEEVKKYKYGCEDCVKEAGKLFHTSSKYTTNLPDEKNLKAVLDWYKKSI